MTNTSNIANINNGYEAVDLGLPSGTLWATCNVGATSPEQAGLYFAWGETIGFTAEQVRAGKRSFSKEVYNAGSAASISTDLSDSNDAATVNLGGKWRMPTKAEIQELIDNCTSAWVANYLDKGVAGTLFTSKTNGKYVFFPDAGCCFDSWVFYQGAYGFYWSGSSYSSLFAWNIDLYSGNVNTRSSKRNYGLSVRAVCEK